MMEDAANDVALIKHALTCGGVSFEAEHVCTREDFLRELTRARPDVILSDHGLPSFSGFAALALARERCPDTPFIFVTGANNEAEAAEARQRGASHWVLKSKLPALASAVQDAVQLAEERAHRKQVERELREREREFQQLLGALRDQATFLLDAEGQIASWNDGAEALLGQTADDMLGHHLSCLYQPEERRVGKPSRDLHAAAAAGPLEEEGWRVRKGGAPFWARSILAARRDEAGRTTGFVQVLRDLTEVRQTEEALRLGESHYRQLVEACPVALLVVSEERIVLANAAAHRLLAGGSAAALPGCALKDFCAPAGREAFTRHLRELAEGGVAPARPDQPSRVAVKEVILRRTDGSCLLAEVTATRVTVCDEPALLLLLRDLTARELAREFDLQAQALAAGAPREDGARERAVFAAAPDAIICTGADGVIGDWNPAAEKIFGHARGEAIGRQAGEVLGSAALSGADLAELAKHFQDSAARGLRQPDQLLVRRASGGKFLADLFVAETAGAAAWRFTLFLRESAPGITPSPEKSAPAPAAGETNGQRATGSGSVPRTGADLIPLCDPTRIFTDLPAQDSPDGRRASRDIVPVPFSRPPLPDARAESERGNWLLKRAHHATEATAEARRSIGVIISQTRTPWGDVGLLSRSQVGELERVIRLLDMRLDERELSLADAETKLANKDRDLAEAEALLKAREDVLAAMAKQARQAADPTVATVSAEEAEAVRKLQAELERNEATLREARAALEERANFVERSEAALLEKMQAQQELELELEQREEDLQLALKRAGLRQDAPDELVAAGA